MCPPTWWPDSLPGENYAAIAEAGAGGVSSPRPPPGGTRTNAGPGDHALKPARLLRREGPLRVIDAAGRAEAAPVLGPWLRAGDGFL
ncbi:hypothetical protein [Spongiactinospora sp. 9N601]|uniref:hypothetical protein n=1 Tax=Spongiactinospora sp. 9N601 TaxID=3375149 RepID=UPI0037AF7BCD